MILSQIEAFAIAVIYHVHNEHYYMIKQADVLSAEISQSRSSSP